ncbi:S16 family serine protease [Vibrio viridaestus]|uniref:endopeptidase La n=1 Tax=Vibrio viridaestus TaxID=2487322 RepID=A0A3N9U669_9VIBR|nr:Lon protease family protein [Vibrio viridaestus]RQW63566.1 Lon protease family protein [Vibrio viridaestus]
MTKEIWQKVTPQLEKYSANLSQYNEIKPAGFFSCQSRTNLALEQFVKVKGVCRILLLNSFDNPLYRELLSERLSELVANEEIPVVMSETLSSYDMFPILQAEKGYIINEMPGLLDHANGGYLIVSANWILANAKDWPELKAAVMGYSINGRNCDPRSPIHAQWTKQYDVKLIITGEREQLANLDFLDADLRDGVAFYSEIEQDFALTTTSINSYLSYIKWICKRYSLPELTNSALEILLTTGTRQTEDQNYVPTSLLWLRAILEEASIGTDEKIDEGDIHRAIQNKYYRESYLPERAANDILEGQVLIETRGEHVGQVNGLTVIDIAGHPMSYGEPARISCVVHFGDGDISDVERKADLGGSLHAKGMMIMQAFVSSALKLDSPLPYSASIVFEQSYSEVDGDSASLAEVCSLLSALSEVPIDQQIAVTGAVDQFGRVQAVGGLNEKIEGFFRVCKHQGFTGKQGVILPETNLINLSLNTDVIESLKKGEFHLWPVTNVDQAVPIILKRAFRTSDKEQTTLSIVDEINKRIDKLDELSEPSSLWQRIKNYFCH